MRIFRNIVCTGLYQFISCSESPKHSDRRHFGIFRRKYINIGVSQEQTLRRLYTEFFRYFKRRKRIGYTGKTYVALVPVDDWEDLVIE